MGAKTDDCDDRVQSVDFPPSVRAAAVVCLYIIETRVMFDGSTVI